MKIHCEFPLLVCGTLFCSCLFLGCADEMVAESNHSAHSEVTGKTAANPTEVASKGNETPGDLSQEMNMSEESEPSSYNELNEFEKSVILKKGTQQKWVGEYTETADPGTYICRQCNAALYNSDHKFQSNCGWPAFDDEVSGAVQRHPDADGMRVEIVCANCQGHLGHVFEGERETEKNIRHCVNSVSMIFIPEGEELPKAIKLNK